MRYLDNNHFIGSLMKAVGIVMMRYNCDIEEATCGVHSGDLVHEMMQEGVDQVVAERIVSDLGENSEKLADLLTFKA
jgi:hypothetical protein